MRLQRELMLGDLGAKAIALDERLVLRRQIELFVQAAGEGSIEQCDRPAHPRLPEHGVVQHEQAKHRRARKRIAAVVGQHRLDRIIVLRHCATARAADRS